MQHMRRVEPPINCRCTSADGVCTCKRTRRRPTTTSKRPTRIHPWPTHRAIRCHHQTSHTITRLFRDAQDGGTLNREISVKCLAAWLLLERLNESDLSYGAVHNIRSFLSNDMAACVRNCLPFGPMEDRGRKRPHVVTLTRARREIPDDGRSCLSITVYEKGEWRILCNARFQHMFRSGQEMEEMIKEQKVVPSFFYGSTVSTDDHSEFVDLLASTYFLQGSGIDRGCPKSSVLKCIDRHGSSFLAIVRFELVCLGTIDDVGMRFSVLPLPTSRYLEKADMSAPVMLGPRPS